MESVFKVGDIVTFKACGNGCYEFGGNNVEYYRGKVISIEEYIHKEKCFAIRVDVTADIQNVFYEESDMGEWKMLENEFKEYVNQFEKDLEFVRNLIKE